MGLGSYPFFCQLMLVDAGGAQKPSKITEQARQVEEKTKWNTGTFKKLQNLHTGHTYGSHGYLDTARGHTRTNWRIIMYSYRRVQEGVTEIRSLARMCQ